MSWMKRRGQPSPNTTNSGVPLYNPNQHSNPQQPYQQQQQWQQPPQQYNNDWYNQSKGPSKTPPIQQYPQQNTNNYWSQQSYNQPPQNYNQTLPNQPANQFQSYNPYGNNHQQQQQPQPPPPQPQPPQPQPPQPQQQQNYYQHGYQQDGYNQQYAQQNYYSNQQQPIQSNSPALTNQVPAQPTEQDPWNWDWEDTTNANSQPQKEPVNQNTITDSFANDESWNWTVDDSSSQNQNSEPVITPKVEEIATTQNNLVHQNSAGSVQNSVVNQEQNSEIYPVNNQQQQLPPVQKIDTLEDLPAIQRLKNDNLTPQWSIESQVSQDSSEDVLLTSESDNRSNILSQSSTTSQSPSRPASTHDVQPEYVPQYRYDQEPVLHQPPVENNLPIREEPINSEYYQGNSQSCIDNVDKALQELSLNAQFENKEIVAPENSSQPPKEEMPPPVKEPTPPPPQKKMTPPLQPPPVLPSTSEANKNPYKKGPGLSHKSMNKVLSEKQPVIATTVSQNTEQSPPVFLQQSTPSAFSAPVPTLRPSDNLGVNLETLPDNSERPDQLPVENIQQKTVRKTSTVQQQWAENCEIAPINDRNQYLETGQLSDADVPVYNQSENAQSTSGDINDSLPPPGLRRLVLGQIEQPESSQSTDNTLDEPPPGLSRMVLGSTALDTKISKSKSIRANVFQPENNIPIAFNQAAVFQPAISQNNEEPPAGLHRMVPGESSSPESSSYMYRTDSNVFQPGNFDDADNYVSESELNQMGVSLVSQRSATIGADTPPVTNQQTISTTGYSSSSSVDPIPSREGAVGIDNESKEADLSIISNTADENISSDNNRREDIDGGPQEEIVAAVRDQTVGQNTTDLASSSANQNDKHRNRNYTTDSEHEQPKERHNRSSSPGGRYDKDRRYYDDRRDRPRDRDSPDSRYRGDRKYDKRRPKDRRYEDDTDYYSDKERRREETREEYERRYSSLRRDKDRPARRGDRDRRDYRDERDARGNDYYYQERYDYNRSSRPSSRSDSMHDSYRERNHRPHDRDRDRDLERTRHRDRDHERDHRRRPRDPYNNPYYQGYNYDPYSPYYQQYQQQYHQYYENLRRTNPQAYAEWYRKYYQQHGGAMPHEERGSVHSGRSSANEELNKDRYTRQSYYSQQSLPHYYRETQNASTVYTVDDSRLLDNTDSLILEDTNVVSQRLTPAKFSTAHVKASIASGNLINILPHYPLDGQPATIEIINLQSLLLDDEEYKELAEFPGPLVKGVTHKKTVIDYCENKIKKASGNSNIQDVESYILMWELLILLLRQNGMVVGTDIAELLMKNRPIETSRRQSVSSSSSTQHIDTLGESSEHGARVSPAMHYKEEFITDKFREYLIYGSGKEALEWAMKHGLWGHALFLASKLDKRTYANVMMRFANGLTMNDPLQTLYQLLSGRQPAAVTCVADDKWGDWRPHLAMILSNTSQRPDLDRKAITTLGDTLQQRGSLYAAHFCYLMAQVEFGRYNTPGVKLVLLSASHQKPFSVFASNEAIFMTEVYEYACGLSDGAFTIPEFQTYKYLMATRMADHGLLEKGLMYLERVAVSIKQDPSRTKPNLVSRVCELADRLKYCDPIQDEGDLDNSKSDHTWLSDLKVVLNDYSMGLITHQSTSNLASLEPEIQQPQNDQQLTEQQWQQQQQQQQQLDYYQQQQQPTSQTQQDLQQPWQQQTEQPTLDYNNQPQQMNYQPGEVQQQPGFDSTNYPEQYWGQQPQQRWEENQTEVNQQDEHMQQQHQQQQQTDYWNAAAQSEPTEQPKIPPTDDSPRPQISIPNQTTKTKSIFDEEDDLQKSGQKPASPIKPKPAPAQQKPASTGWFGGIWSKLALRPKNQMKLPDDKNPTIVWDSEKKRWVNLEEDNGEVAQELKPPPSMSDMFPNRSAGSPPMPPGMPMGPQSLPAQIPSYNAQMNDANATNPAIPTAVENQGEEGPKPASQPNMFKLQRGRNIKKAYVDVFNPGGAKPSPKGSVPAPEVFGAPAPAASTGNQMNFFVPQPVADLNAPTDFLTQANVNTEDNTQGGVPMMYNPNQFSN